MNLDRDWLASFGEILVDSSRVGDNEVSGPAHCFQSTSGEWMKLDDWNWTLVFFLRRIVLVVAVLAALKRWNLSSWLCCWRRFIFFWLKELERERVVQHRVICRETGTTTESNKPMNRKHLLSCVSSRGCCYCRVFLLLLLSLLSSFLFFVYFLLFFCYLIFLLFSETRDGGSDDGPADGEQGAGSAVRNEGRGSWWKGGRPAPLEDGTTGVVGHVLVAVSQIAAWHTQLAKSVNKTKYVTLIITHPCSEFLPIELLLNSLSSLSSLSPHFLSLLPSSESWFYSLRLWLEIDWLNQTRWLETTNECLSEAIESYLEFPFASSFVNYHRHSEYWGRQLKLIWLRQWILSLRIVSFTFFSFISFHLIIIFFLSLSLKKEKKWFFSPDQRFSSPTPHPPPSNLMGFHARFANILDIICRSSLLLSNGKRLENHQEIQPS